MSLNAKVLPRLSYYMPFWFGLSLFVLISLLFVDINLDVSKVRSWPDFFSISTNILIGIIVSFVFYFFIVYIPESRRKLLIKTSALKMYKTSNTIYCLLSFPLQYKVVVTI
jgi:preprotein translocase subunit SecY